MDLLELSKGYKLEKKEVFGKGAVFHHMGIILKEKTNTPYSELHYIYDSTQKVEVAFFNLNGLIIEIVLPRSEESPILKALTNKLFYHHICFSVPNIQKALSVSTNHGIRRISRITPAVAFEDRNICWCIGKDYGLMELIEK